MSTSPLPSEITEARAQRVSVTADALVVDLVDGRTISVPLAWYPRLAHGSPVERAHWRFIGEGEGVHWPELDEDISVEGLLAGRRSGETQVRHRCGAGSNVESRTDRTKPPSGRVAVFVVRRAQKGAETTPYDTHLPELSAETRRRERPRVP